MDSYPGLVFVSGFPPLAISWGGLVCRLFPDLPEVRPLPRSLGFQAELCWARLHKPRTQVHVVTERERCSSERREMPRIAAPTRVFQGVLRPFRLNFLGADLLLKARPLWDRSSVARSQDPFINICSDVRITGLDSTASPRGCEGTLLLFP